MFQPHFVQDSLYSLENVAIRVVLTIQTTLSTFPVAERNNDINTVHTACTGGNNSLSAVCQKLINDRQLRRKICEQSVYGVLQLQ